MYGGGSWGYSKGGGWKGKGYGKGGWGQQEKQEWGVPGLNQTLIDAMAPIKDTEPETQDIVRKMAQKAQKTAEKWGKDERLAAKHQGIATPTHAQALIEEFVEHVMGGLRACAYEKAWFSELDWHPCLLHLVLYVFGGNKTADKLFTRTLKPQLISHVREGLLKWHVEERITLAMEEAVTVAGIKETYQKKAAAHLSKAYDDAHFKSPYGTCSHSSPEIAVLQDFVTGWITDFVARAWDIFENGLEENTRTAHVVCVTMLFQKLMDPNVACMPSEISTEITKATGGLPAAPWDFVHQAAQKVFDDHDAAELRIAAAQAAKRARLGK